jgi:hypothetical protein
MRNFYWYHVSRNSNWKQENHLAKPMIGRVDDKNDPNEQIPFIAVCPTFQQCIVAIGDFHCAWRFRIYRTKAKQRAVPADWVFDYSITSEHRLYTATRFEHVGSLLYEDLPTVPAKISDYGDTKCLSKVLDLFNESDLAAKFRPFDIDMES